MIPSNKSGKVLVSITEADGNVLQSEAVSMKDLEKTKEAYNVQAEQLSAQGKDVTVKVQQRITG
jgi:uncharacterized tellurite resistance protein B-like protein